MRILSRSLALVAAILWTASARAEDEKFKSIHVADLVALQKAQAKVFIYDANTEEFRASHGIIPGAKILSHFDSYDVKKELPSDKGAKLVFYCSNTH